MAPKKAKLDLSYLRSLVHQTEPAPITTELVKKMLTPAAFKDYQYTIKLWKLFAETVLQTPEEEAAPFQTAPSVHHTKLFLRWLAGTRTGILEDNITDVTLGNRLSSLKRAIKLHANYQYNRAQNAELEAAQKELINENLVSTRAFSKPIAPLPVAEDLIQYSWVCDEYQHPHPRARLQLGFSIILMSLLGGRPGEFIESEAWRNTNEGLIYSDIDLLWYESDVYKGYLLHLRLRNRKGHRNNHKNSPVMLLYEEPTCRSMCPVTHFIAHGLADGVFEGCSSFHDIQKKGIVPGTTSYKFKLNPSAVKLPILRSILPDGTVSKDRILTYNCFRNMIKGIGQRAGYEAKLSSYCFRRAFANAVEKTATSAQRRQLMGHTNDETFQYYISGLVGIDSQSMVRGREQRHSLIDENTSMMMSRNVFAPKPPGSQLTDHSNITHTILEDLKNESPDIKPVLGLTSSQQYEMRRQSRNTAYNKKRQNFFEGTGESRRIIPESTTAPLRSPSRYLQALWKFEPERKAIVDLMYPSGNGESSPQISLGDIVEPMIKLANSGIRFAYKSAETVEDDRCGKCKKSLNRARPTRMNAHLLDCGRRRRIQDAQRHMTRQFDSKQMCSWNDCNLRFRGRSCGKNSCHVTEHLKVMSSHQCLWNHCGQTFKHYTALAHHVSEKHGIPNEWTIHTKMHYCYEHDEWCISNQSTMEHIMRKHFSQLSDFCGLILQGGVVVVAAHCLFCLGDNKLHTIDRFAQFPEVYTLHNHMKKHLDSGMYPSVCPHPRCTDPLDSEKAFWEHAISVHGVPPFGPRRTTLKRKAPDDEDTDSDSESVAVDLHESAIVGEHDRRDDDDDCAVVLALGRPQRLSGTDSMDLTRSAQLT